jgi:hypothetical protein
LGQLPFTSLEGKLAICIRMEGDGATHTYGRIIRADFGEQLEWIIDEDDLQRLGLLIHHLASTPEHEYDRLEMEAATEVDVHIRMVDASDWIQQIRT